MKENNKYLKKAISGLPTFKVNKEGLWGSIKAKLENRSRSKILFSNLPEHKAPENLWQKVKHELDQKNKSKLQHLTTYITRAAAVITLLITIGIAVKHYRETKFSDGSFIIEKNETNRKQDVGIESIYNQALCKANPQICSTPLFKGLDSQLNEVKGEIDKIEPMVKNGDPQLMKYFHRLVNEKVKIEKKLVKIIIES
jgi:hypothetical protein